ncbi:hypothetical protein OMQ_00830 [Enterococcus saccharolyticus subsp. saccharolyticus ATCC 43076]|uniref:CAT RNA-binding domain-containing protein n=1 Tax=Enterococcus saccharolyticus subsp. saccharolyticus ATCC 43076 TaxID=1139996 RepID=S0JNM0_9ENTE|nr:hypothetical protein OMQ_00830 [Enterococcus saccharolyticus subsp. saccharolyticus ATCC 43076]EOT80680.1 hypothetical protein I572_01210 [Enterococcus saccharolyticus subsp. saccharolyticus ATCC 43076]
MYIDKILNNNVVVTNDKSNELIAMGKGIAFNKKIGDALDETKIDKIYRLASGEVSQKFQELLEDVPMEYLTISKGLSKIDCLTGSQVITNSESKNNPMLRKPMLFVKRWLE